MLASGKRVKVDEVMDETRVPPYKAYAYWYEMKLNSLFKH